jgi:hypothetical protein
MARLLKNPLPNDNATLAMQMPIVPNSSYGDPPANGLMRFNQASSRIEFYYNNAWSQVAKIGSVQLVTDSFVGDGVTNTFTMSQSESDPTAVAVFVGGVYQQPTLNYSVNGTTTITFSVAPPAVTMASPTAIIVIHNINSTNVPA